MGKTESSVQFVKRLMNTCPAGPLVQVFIVEAIVKYASLCATTPIPDDGLIDAETWMEIAQWIDSEVKAKYKTLTL